MKHGGRKSVWRVEPKCMRRTGSGMTLDMIRNM